MSAHPGSMPGWNLALRLLIELAALAGFAYAGWWLADGPLAVVAAIIAPLAAATLWGVFAVRGDPSRSGRAPVPVPGWVRLLLELAVFGGGAACYAIAGAPVVAFILGGLLVVHLAFSVARLRWLLRT